MALPHLNGGYTIFGQCDEATVELVKQIARMSRDASGDQPFRPVDFTHIAIVHGTGTAPRRGRGRPEEASGSGDEATGEFQQKPAGIRPGGHAEAASQQILITANAQFERIS